MNSEIEKIKSGVFEIGQKVVCCNLQCEAIENKPNVGIIPRCLFFEYENRDSDNGCVVVGINPGRSTKNSDETNFYLRNYINNQPSYNSIIEYWKINYWTYYKFLKDFINCVGYVGPILWTELVKCQKDYNTKTLPLQTYRTCTNKFLSDELKLVPKKWPLLAVGREAHTAISYLCPDKSVLGIPHPTSSKGHFSGLFMNSTRKQFVKTIRDKIDDFKQNYGKEMWLSNKN